LVSVYLPGPQDAIVTNEGFFGWDSLLKQEYSEKVTIASWVGGGSNVWYIEKWIARNGRKWYRII